MKILRGFVLMICIAVLLPFTGCFYRRPYPFMPSVSNKSLSSIGTESDPAADSSKAVSSGSADELNSYVSTGQSATESSFPKTSVTAQVQYERAVPPSIECEDIVFIDAERTISLIKQNGKFGVINFKGDIVIPIEYDEIYYCDECGGLLCNKGINALLFDENGKFIMEHGAHGGVGMYYLWDTDINKPARIEGEGLDDFTYLDNDSLFPLDNKNGFYIVEGVTNINKNYGKYSYDVSNLSGKYGVINNIGKLVVPLIYDDLQEFGNGLAAAKKDGKWGYINSSGTIVAPFIYDSPIDCYSDGWHYVSAYDFTEGYAVVTKEGKWGYLGTDGNLAIPLDFEGTRPVKNKRAWVKTNGLWGVIEFK